MSGFDADSIASEAHDRGEDVLATVVGQALGYASACWENLEGAGVFRSTECREALDSLLGWLRPKVDAPCLGLATTRELLDELRARIEVDYFAGGGGLEYTTVAGRPGGNLASGGHHVVSEPARAGDRVEDGGVMGTLVRCPQCSGDGLLHDPDERPAAVAPSDG